MLCFHCKTRSSLISNVLTNVSTIEELWLCGQSTHYKIFCRSSIVVLLEAYEFPTVALNRLAQSPLLRSALCRIYRLTAVDMDDDVLAISSEPCLRRLRRTRTQRIIRIIDTHHTKLVTKLLLTTHCDDGQENRNSLISFFVVVIVNIEIYLHSICV